MSVPLVLTAAGRRPAWMERLEGAVLHAADAIPDEFSSFDSVWIDAVGLEPLQVARRVARIEASVQTIVVAPPEDLGVHERALLFTPGLGEIWLLTPHDVGPEPLDRSRELTATRRQYRESRGSLVRALGQFSSTQPRRTIVSDAYLAALLEVLPDPVVSVDEEERIVSWSAAAAAAFEIPDTAALGRPVVQVLELEDPGGFEDALERSRSETVRLDIEVNGASGDLLMQAVMTPVDTGGVSVRAIVMRDVTRERESLMRLEREVELRSRSYAAMSHEIRTPINAIMGYNELLRMGVGDEKREEYLLRSQKAASHLLSLVNDVLDLSKLESGVLEIQPEITPVEELIQELLYTLEPLATERETPLEVRCQPGEGQISTDPKRLKQILINLISNALKFGQSRPVRVSCARKESSLIFEVEDQGRGIEASQLERIFEEFIQVGESQEGTGLGLPISRKLAELLGGELTAESEEGRGSTFRLRLPIHMDGAEASTRQL